MAGGQRKGSISVRGMKDLTMVIPAIVSGILSGGGALWAAELLIANQHFQTAVAVRIENSKRRLRNYINGVENEIRRDSEYWQETLKERAIDLQKKVRNDFDQAREDYYHKHRQLLENFFDENWHSINDALNNFLSARTQKTEALTRESETSVNKLVITADEETEELVKLDREAQDFLNSRFLSVDGEQIGPAAASMADRTHLHLISYFEQDVFRRRIINSAEREVGQMDWERFNQEQIAYVKSDGLFESLIRDAVALQYDTPSRFDALMDETFDLRNLVEDKFQEAELRIERIWISTSHEIAEAEYGSAEQRFSENTLFPPSNAVYYLILGSFASRENAERELRSIMTRWTMSVTRSLEEPLVCDPKPGRRINAVAVPNLSYDEAQKLRASIIDGEIGPTDAYLLEKRESNGFICRDDDVR